MPSYSKFIEHKTTDKNVFESIDSIKELVSNYKWFLEKCFANSKYHINDKVQLVKNLGPFPINHGWRGMENILLENNVGVIVDIDLSFNNKNNLPCRFSYLVKFPFTYLVDTYHYGNLEIPEEKLSTSYISKGSKCFQLYDEEFILYNNMARLEP